MDHHPPVSGVPPPLPSSPTIPSGMSSELPSSPPPHFKAPQVPSSPPPPPGRAPTVPLSRPGPSAEELHSQLHSAIHIQTSPSSRPAVPIIPPVPINLHHSSTLPTSPVPLPIHTLSNASTFDSIPNIPTPMGIPTPLVAIARSESKSQDNEFIDISNESQVLFQNENIHTQNVIDSEIPLQEPTKTSFTPSPTIPKIPPIPANHDIQLNHHESIIHPVPSSTETLPSTSNNNTPTTTGVHKTHETSHIHSNDPSSVSTLQLIDESKVFHPLDNSYFNENQILADNIGLNYHVVSVFGSQSSGKSTLLNILFNTNFDIMNAKVKRQQTTKGIWLSHTNKINTSTDSKHDTRDLFILDVEGSDGSERGEDQDFERKAALFAIAVSEVMIVNVWEHQIGLYQGNNLGLLKTVFEVNLSLFNTKTTTNKSNSPSNKMLLLFVIRDHVNVTPMSSLSSSLISELEKIWDNLSKPDNLINSSLYDFFDIKFVGLSHKILQNEQFIKDVKDLGDRFDSKGTEESIFKPIYHKNLPIESWSMYADNCWDLIENNKDLDLPTQQILVARFKTEEFADEAFKNIEEEFDESITKKSKMEKDTLIEKLNVLKQKALDQYEEHAAKYNQTVVLEKRNYLIGKIENLFLPVIKKLLVDFQESIFNKLGQNVKSQSASSGSFLERLRSEAQTSEQKYFTMLNEFVECQLISKPTSNNFLEEFQTKIQESVRSICDTQLKTIINSSKKTITIKFKDSAIALLSHPEIDVWDNILIMFNSTLDHLLNRYKIDKTLEDTNNKENYDFQLGLSSEENEKTYTQIRANAWQSLNEIVHDYLKEDQIVSILRERFEAKFRYDENDNPRFWKNEEEVDLNYRVSRDHALEVFNALSVARTKENKEVMPDVRIESSDDDDMYEDEFGISHSQKFSHILSEVQKENVLKRFRRQINMSVIDSKRSTIKSTTHIPPWIYIVIVVLGWNEFMMIIRNPLYVTLLLLSAVGFYFIHKFDLWGPVINVVESIIGETKTTIKSKLKDFVLDEDEKNKYSSASIPLSDMTKTSNSSEVSIQSSVNKVPPIPEAKTFSSKSINDSLSEEINIEPVPVVTPVSE